MESNEKVQLRGDGHADLKKKKKKSHLPFNFISSLKPKRRQSGKEGEGQEETLLLLGRLVCRNDALCSLFGCLTRCEEGWSMSSIFTSLVLPLQAGDHYRPGGTSAMHLAFF